ncbi:MAG: CHAT domain-containing protein [Blastococcus sp.]
MSEDDWFECFVDFRPESEGTEYRDLHIDSQGNFTLDLTRARPSHWSARTVDWLSRWLQSSEGSRAVSVAATDGSLDTRGEAVCLLGYLLYEALFVDPRHRAVFESRLEANRHVRFNLRFHPGSEELARLPWEFLCRPMPDGLPQFLATSTELVLSRVVPEPTTVTRNRPLHILVAVLQPGLGFETVLAKPTLDAVAALGDKFDPDDGTPAGPETRCRWEPMREPVTYTALRDRLVDIDLPRPDVVHIVGHGQPGGLVFPTEPPPPEQVALQGLDQGRAYETVSGEIVAQMFKPATNGRQAPSLVVLETCSGGDAGNQVLSTAQEILRAGASAVVAMQHEVRQDVAGRFIDAFYASIGRGNTIGEAVRDGRLGIIGGGDLSKGAHREPYFGIPIYLVHEKDRRLLDTPRPAATSIPETPPPLPVVDVRPWNCPVCGTAAKKRFCPACGWSVFCPSCKAERDEDVQFVRPYKFCENCGKPVPIPPPRDVIELASRAS